MTRVVFLQEYLPQYRVPLFELLREEARSTGIELVVAAGEPNATQARRGDSVALDWVLPIRQREFRLLGRRLAIRSTRQLTKNADLVVMEQARRNIDLYAALLRRSGPRVALWGHGSDRVKTPSRLDARVSRWALKKAHWFYAYSEGAAAAVAMQGFQSDRVTVLNNAIDTSALKLAIKSLNPGRLRELSTKLDLRGKTAVYVGALDTYKRIPMLIESAIAAHAIESDFRLIIAGDGVERPTVELADRSHSFVHYVGPQFGDDKASFLAVADVLVSPGSVGLSVLDSFTAGAPMITTRWPFHGPEAEYLEDGTNAIITDDSITAFTEGVVGVLSDRAKLDTLRQNCVADAERYTIENMADRFFDGIRRALLAGQE